MFVGWVSDDGGTTVLYVGRRVRGGAGGLVWYVFFQSEKGVVKERKEHRHRREKEREEKKK